MAYRTWQVSKVGFCERAAQNVALETEVVYPADPLPDPPRVVAHRCSNAIECNLFEQPACIWCGTNPDHQPL